MMRLLPSLTTLLSAATLAAATEYGFDCSFPIFNKTLNCGNLLGDRQGFYENFMDGCRKEYGAEFCDDDESTRIAMNIRQPQSMVNYTSGGFRKIRAPASLQKMLTDFWENNKDDMEEEEWSEGNIFVNHWEAPTHMMTVQDPEYVGGGVNLQNAIWAAAKAGIEDWTTMRLRPSSLYGIRVYTEGAVLNPHVDRLPLVSSAIVNVAQDVDEPWPLEVYDRFGNAVNITMEPGTFLTTLEVSFHNHLSF
jgi:prolyl 4-hydroxylase